MSVTLQRSVIPRRPLLWLSAALLFLVPTLLGTIVIWAPLLFLCSLLAKFWMEKRDRRLRSVTLKIALAALAFGAVYLSYGSPRGLEPGVTLLVVLGSLKILESHTARDFHVMVMVGWVLCLSAFLLSQDFGIALCLLASFVLLIGALVEFHRRGVAGRSIWPPLRTTFKLLAQALPIVVLLFFFFPRGTGAMRLRMPGSPIGTTGFSGDMAPGTVASIATSTDVAFRAEFPDGNRPARADLYWRGAVLEKGDGLNWQAGHGVGRARQAEQSSAPRIRQRITIEPHAGRWLFALDRPLEAPAGAWLVPGRYLHSIRPITSIRRYEVVSAADGGEDDLHPRERASALQPPSAVSPAMLELVQSWTARAESPRAVVIAALEFFRTQGFVYSLSPGAYAGPNALDDLLFRRKIGFCEHYAGTFATLMRLAGIPARVVVGYQGGQFNQYGNYLLVRQSDAHAWCEVWLPEGGWTRIDPTTVIAPARLSLGSLRDLGTTSVRQEPDAGMPLVRGEDASLGLLGNARMAWDTVSYAWDARVLSFDVEGQREFLMQLGMGVVPAKALLLWLLGAAATLLALYAALILWRSRVEPDAVKQLYDTFCRKAAQLGAERSASEGPVDFARRAAALLPQHAPLIERIARNYVALRYSPDGATSAAQAFAADVRAFTRRATNR
jgi:transglutaminase-like putative cysteine protease